MRRPYAAVLDTESAAAGTSRDSAWLGLPVELEGEIAAVAAAVNAHCVCLLRLASNEKAQRPIFGPLAATG